MPKSKSKRKRYTPPPKPKPKPSPRWIPITFAVLLSLGLVSILTRYALPEAFEIFNNDWFLWGGLLSVASGFWLATRWR